MIIAGIWLAALLLTACSLTLGTLLGDAEEPVFTRAAFTLLASTLLLAVHRAPREPLRERVAARMRRWASRPERLADLSRPLPHERVTGRPCLACSELDNGPCHCTDDCGHIRCTGERPAS